ncbi:MAG: hypothetical protein ACK4M3_02745 [Pyrobaculum sp.]
MKLGVWRDNGKKLYFLETGRGARVDLGDVRERRLAVHHGTLPVCY